jgi:hypothetical protein
LRPKPKEEKIKEEEVSETDEAKAAILCLRPSSAKDA